MALARTTIGVDLGHCTIKVVQTEKTAGGYRIVKAGSAPTPADSMRDGQVAKPVEIGSAIKTAMKEAHIHASHAVIAAAGGAVFVRTVPFPKMTPQMLRDSVKFEAGRYVPGSVEESYVEAEIVNPINDTQMNVLLAAAPKDLVIGRIAACREAGLSVDVVDLEAFSAYRSLIETDPTRRADEKTYLFLNIGATATSVSIVSKGVFLMHRTMPSGGNSLTDALKQAFKLETVDAEAGKTVLDMHDLISGTAAENPPLRVMASQVDDLIREIRRSMNYLQTQNQQAEGQTAEIDELILTGGGAKLKGLDSYIAAKLGLNAKCVGVLDNAVVTQSGVIADQGLDYAVATGLAMRGHLKAA